MGAGTPAEGALVLRNVWLAPTPCLRGGGGCFHGVCVPKRGFMGVESRRAGESGGERVRRRI